MTATATATREIFYLVEQPGRFLFKAGATNDWEAATAALSAGPAWRSCITARVNNADQLCRLIDRKYSDRLHGDSGWLALMPDQIQFVRSLALKAGDDFRRANPGCSASPHKQPRKARKTAAAAKPKPAGTPGKKQPAEEAKAKADQHSADRAAEPSRGARSQSKAAPAPDPAAKEAELQGWQARARNMQSEIQNLLDLKRPFTDEEEGAGVELVEKALRIYKEFLLARESLLQNRLTSDRPLDETLQAMDEMFTAAGELASAWKPTRTKAGQVCRVLLLTIAVAYASPALLMTGLLVTSMAGSGIVAAVLIGGPVWLIARVLRKTS